MTSRPTPTCDHELRPGTTVCLRCQHAERGARRARQRVMIARGGAAIALLAVIVAAGVAGASALRSRKPSISLARVSIDTTPSGGAAADTQTASSSTLANPAVLPGASPAAPDAALPTPAAAPASARRIALTVPQGRTPLQDTLVVERAGDTVRVLFDRVMTRTRRPDKFEAIMRSTLPEVFGPLADSALRALPVGAVARAGDLVTALPERGLRIPVAGGGAIAVWPETRPGRDGPLVVSYRAVADR